MPPKIFLSVPTDTEVREKWYQQLDETVGYKLNRSRSAALHCCEDHFDVSYKCFLFRDLLLIFGVH